ncbi:hypothetical protein J1605_012499 [Eschrichtius robustus]|uniref:Uncharacterized protein n=1 Tax=Eschrichtius robustus TaxID=9764 RepID=A0AB34GLI9_ESCRO|nr:hypothetical protein J1605_012499 [Eschrichtius robustus]
MENKHRTKHSKPSSPEPAPPSEAMDTERPGTPVPPVEVPELMDTASLEPEAWDAKPDQVLDHPIEAIVAKGEMKLFLLFHSEGPEEVALEEDPQMDEGAMVEAWLEAVGMVSMKALVEEWVLVMDISPMKALDMGGPMATSLIMSLVTEATTIEGHPLVSTVAMMALAMEEGVTKGMMETTAMEETCQTALFVDIS